MVKPKQVGHLVLNVRDVEASEKFYTEVLGFEIAMKRPGATFLTCGQVHHDLALFQATDVAEPIAKGRLGLNHFAIQVEDMDELKDVHRRLKENGMDIDRGTDHGMTKSIYFADPDGINIEVFYDVYANQEEGLAVMRDPSRVNTELVLEEVSAP